jgi:hypothetical protein
LPKLEFLRPIGRAIRANIAPGLFLQSIALIVLLGYELSPSVHRAFDELGELKKAGGIPAAIASTAFFGGLLPFLFLTAKGRIASGRRFSEFLFYVGFWGYKGFEVDLLYRLQAEWFGNEATFSTIFLKTCVDQFGYGPLLAVPTQTLMFLWKDSGFRLAEVRVRLAEEPLLQRLLVIAASNWIVWVPAVSIIYALPTPLQLPLSNLVLVFWTLILTFVSDKGRPSRATAEKSGAPANA